VTRTRLRPWALDWMIPLIGVFVMSTAAVAAEAPGATLYDVTQAAKVVGKRVPHRIAEGALAGPAKLNTPFCPEKLASKINGDECWVTAIGSDNIDLTTGQGTLTAVIIPVGTGPGENPFAAPQVALERMSVSGRIDFSPALAGEFYGTVSGRVDGRHRFTGVFLQPFDGDVEANLVLGPFFPPGFTMAQFLCGTTPHNPHFAADYKWVEVERVGETVQRTGKCIDVQPHQISLGYPTLRFDLFFE
jgi:hypothetical protein